MYKRQAQQFLGHQEALLIYVAVDGITSFLFEETHHMEFTQEKPGGQTVNCEVGGRIFRDIAHDFQNLFAAGAGAYIFQMAPGRKMCIRDRCKERVKRSGRLYQVRGRD